MGESNLLTLLLNLCDQLLRSLLYGESGVPSRLVHACNLRTCIIIEAERAFDGKEVDIKTMKPLTAK